MHGPTFQQQARGRPSAAAQPAAASDVASQTLLSWFVNRRNQRQCLQGCDRCATDCGRDCAILVLGRRVDAKRQRRTAGGSSEWIHAHSSWQMQRRVISVHSGWGHVILFVIHSPGFLCCFEDLSVSSMLMFSYILNVAGDLDVPLQEWRPML